MIASKKEKGFASITVFFWILLSLQKKIFTVYCEMATLMWFFPTFLVLQYQPWFFGYCRVFFSSEFLDVDAGQQQELLSFFAGNTEKSF